MSRLTNQPREHGRRRKDVRHLGGTGPHRLALVLSAILGIMVLQGNDNSSCTLDLMPVGSVCVAPGDCEGLPKPACSGMWACVEGLCTWLCQDVSATADTGPDATAPGDAGEVQIPCECLEPCHVPWVQAGECNCLDKCDDSDWCTIDTCYQDKCYHQSLMPPGGGPCMETVSLECSSDEKKCPYYCSCTLYVDELCDDGDPTTVDSCGVGGPGCNYSSEPQFGPPEGVGDPWDDEACIQLHSDSVQGFYTKMKDCDDGDNLTNDWCDDATGQCANESIPEACFDADPCTLDFKEEYQVEGDEVCTNVPVDCNDKDACTDDWCDPAQGGKCQHTPLDCDDQNACTEDVCDVLVGCRNVPELNRDVMLDKCSYKWCDPATGQWVKEPIPSKCAKKSMCIVPFVTADGDCDWDFFDCDDGNKCTIGGCGAGECKYELAPACQP